MNNLNWKLIFKLSIFGLLMAIATISLIPEKMEPIFWLIIFTVCAYIIAKQATGLYFLHGFLTSLVNSIWITIAHVASVSTYIANHPQAASMNAKMPAIMQAHQRIAMIIMGLPFGAIFGLILGLFCLIASKIVKK